MIGHGCGERRADQLAVIIRAYDKRAAALRISGQKVALIGAFPIIEIGKVPKDRDSQIGNRIERGDDRRARQFFDP
ncbi:MAG TPA: hypothetical protein VF489_08415 [Sphingobium sp.]